MPYEIGFKPSALREIRKLDEAARKVIISEIAVCLLKGLRLLRSQFVVIEYAIAVLNLPKSLVPDANVHSQRSSNLANHPAIPEKN
jgi:hypothetical protein